MEKVKKILKHPLTWAISLFLGVALAAGNPQADPGLFIDNVQLNLLAGQSYQTSPFTVDDAAKSITITATRNGWPEKRNAQNNTQDVIEMILEVSNDGGQTWYLAGSMGSIGGYAEYKTGVEATKNYTNIGLYPNKGRMGKITIKAYSDISTTVYAHNSITVGTPGHTSGFGDTATVAVDSGSSANTVLFGFEQRSNHATLQNFKYNNVAETRIDQAGAAAYATAAYWIIGTGTGSHSLSFDNSAQGTDTYMLGGVALSGVDQSTPQSGVQKSTTASSPSVSVTSAVGDLVVDAAIFTNTDTPNTSTAGAGQTVLYQEDLIAGNAAAGGNSYKSGAASVTMTWTGNTVPGAAALIAFSVKAAGAAAVSTSNSQTNVNAQVNFNGGQVSIP